MRDMYEFGRKLDMVVEDALRRTPPDKGVRWFLDRLLEDANMPRARARFIAEEIERREARRPK